LNSVALFLYGLFGFIIFFLLIPCQVFLTSYQIHCRLLNGTRFQRSFKDKKDAEADAARLCNERSVELKKRTVSLNHRPFGFAQGLESLGFAQDLEPRRSGPAGRIFHAKREIFGLKSARQRQRIADYVTTIPLQPAAAGGL
jgi:hypothetical protein